MFLLSQNLSGGHTEGYPITFSSVLEAYYDCRVGKRSTANEQLFEVNGLRRVYKLYEELRNGTYEIGKSIAFIVTRPVKREVFAATFRDRIVHHWICLRLEPLFEAYLFPCMKSNRKGRGTFDAVREAALDIMDASDLYKKDCWIWKFDLQGFFMSIDKRILLAKLRTFIEERYVGEDKPTLLWLVEKVVMHCPQKNCIRRCSIREWDGLAANKSLFGQDDFHGVAIGNLTSQMFANFLLYDVVRWLKDNGVTRVVEFVDDFFTAIEKKEVFLDVAPRLRECLKEMGLTLHPRKSYLQHYTKGVGFVGCIIKPHRIYLSERVRRNAERKIHWWSLQGADDVFAEEKIENFLAVVNSYLGLARHYQTRRFREKLGRKILTSTWKGRGLYFADGFKAMKLRRPRRGKARWEYMHNKFERVRERNILSI